MHILASLIPGYAPVWDNRGKCHMDEKRIQQLARNFRHNCVIQGRVVKGQ